jgi:hypothetical protein
MAADREGAIPVSVMVTDLMAEIPPGEKDPRPRGGGWMGCWATYSLICSRVAR